MQKISQGGRGCQHHGVLDVTEILQQIGQKCDKNHHEEPDKLAYQPLLAKQ